MAGLATNGRLRANHRAAVAPEKQDGKGVLITLQMTFIVAFGKKYLQLLSQGCRKSGLSDRDLKML